MFKILYNMSEENPKLEFYKYKHTIDKEKKKIFEKYSKFEELLKVTKRAIDRKWSFIGKHLVTLFPSLNKLDNNFKYTLILTLFTCIKRQVHIDELSIQSYDENVLFPLIGAFIDLGEKTQLLLTNADDIKLFVERKTAWKEIYAIYYTPFFKTVNKPYVPPVHVEIKKKWKKIGVLKLTKDPTDADDKIFKSNDFETVPPDSYLENDRTKSGAGDHFVLYTERDRLDRALELLNFPPYLPKK